MTDTIKDTPINDGLTISVNEEMGEITFNWDDETHPQYNYLKDVSEEKFLEMLLNQVKQTCAEHETENLHDPE